MLIDRTSAVIDETIAFIDKVYNGDVERMIETLFDLNRPTNDEFRVAQRIIDTQKQI